MSSAPTPGMLSDVLDGPLQHLIYYPKNWTADGNHPTIVFLHGTGGVNNPDSIRGQSITKMLTDGRIPGGNDKFPFVVIHPIAPLWGWPQHNDKVVELVESLVPTAGIDRSRLYLTGQSMGGNGAWTLGMQKADMFAAVVPVCGFLLDSLVDVPFPIASDASEKLKGEAATALATTPVWAFHGANDALVYVKQSDQIIKALEETGHPATKYTRYEEAPGLPGYGEKGAGHASYELAYATPELYEWLLTLTNPAAAEAKQ